MSAANLRKCFGEANLFCISICHPEAFLAQAKRHPSRAAEKTRIFNDLKFSLQTK